MGETFRNHFFKIKIGIILTILYAFCSCYDSCERHITVDRLSHKAVLWYYKYIDRDPLKYDAATFLLENMKYHFAFNEQQEDATWESWRQESDEIIMHLIEKYDFDKIPHDTITNIQYKRTHLLKDGSLTRLREIQNLRKDEEIISFSFLTEHIDNAFRVWKSSKYAKGLSFEDFKEYILPYTSLYGYGFLNSGKRYHDIFANILDVNSTENITECISKYNHIIRNIRDINGVKEDKSPLGLYDLYSNGSHKCTDIAVYACNILRACGVPIVADNNIAYRHLSGKHFYCNVYDVNNNKFMAFNAESSLPETFDYETPITLNIYRNTYAAQKNTPFFQRNNGEKIPEELSNPCIKDVTEEHKKVYTITLPFKKETNNNLAYLATFNRDWGGTLCVTWGVIDTISKTVKFDNVIPHILYFPVYYRDNKQESFDKPFYITLEDCDNTYKKNHIPYTHNDTSKTTLHITRKFPRKQKMIKRAEALIGGRFLGANKEDFSDAKVLYTISETPNPIFKEISLNNIGEYLYYRFEAPAHNPHANISMIEWVTEKKYNYENTALATREHILFTKDTIKISKNSKYVKLLDKNPSKMNFAKEYDGNMQTSPGAYPNITMSLNCPQIATKVRFAPLNADNGIKAGNIYQLSFWNEGLWEDLGIKKAKYEFITFEDVPQGKIYWLRDLSEGREELPFVIDKGKQLFIYSDLIVQAIDKKP